MKITIEAVFSVLVGAGNNSFAKEIYLNDEFKEDIKSSLEFLTN